MITLMEGLLIYNNKLIYSKSKKEWQAFYRRSFVSFVENNSAKKHKLSLLSVYVCCKNCNQDGCPGIFLKVFL